MNTALKNRLKKIRLFACDFDGVMTDGFVYVSDDGREMVKCSRRDSMGINALKKAGIEVVVISTEANPVVMKRCEKMKVRCWQKIESANGKADILKAHMKKEGYGRDEVAYIGDDINDRGALEAVGIGITVSDGHEFLKKIAHYVTAAKGGDHAVREVCELILKAKGIEASY